MIFFPANRAIGWRLHKKINLKKSHKSKWLSSEPSWLSIRATLTRRPSSKCSKAMAKLTNASNMQSWSKDMTRWLFTISTSKNTTKHCRKWPKSKKKSKEMKPCWDMLPSLSTNVPKKPSKNLRSKNIGRLRFQNWCQHSWTSEKVKICKWLWITSPTSASIKGIANPKQFTIWPFISILKSMTPNEWSDS